MADISITPAGNTNIGAANGMANPRNAEALTSIRRTVAAEDPAKADRAKETQDAQQSRQERLKDVIAVSEDGDTVQATKDSRERLAEDAFGRVEVKRDQEEDDERTGVPAAGENAEGVAAEAGAAGGARTETGEVTENAIAESAETAAEGTESQQAIEERNRRILENDSKTEEAIDESVEKQLLGTSRTDFVIEEGRREAEQEEEEEEYNQKLASYNGISDQRLEQMYLQGEISRMDYDKEMEAREERREAENAGAEQFSNEMTGMSVLEESGKLDLSQIQTAFSPEANDTISAEDRMAIIETMDARVQNAVTDQNVMTDANTSGEETIKKVVFS